MILYVPKKAHTIRREPWQISNINNAWFKRITSPNTTTKMKKGSTAKPAAKGSSQESWLKGEVAVVK